MVQESNEFDLPEPSRVSRGRFLLVAAATLAAACTPKVPTFPQPAYNPNIDTKGIQQKYVGEILEIEDDFMTRGLTIGDPAIRRHTELVAKMYAEYYETKTTPDQLISSIILMPTTTDFTTFLKQMGNLPGSFTEKEARNRVAQYIGGGTAVINLGNEVFNPNLLRREAELGTVPSLWNPLRELRITETHEMSHNTKANSDDPMLKLLDPKGRYQDKRFEGFRVEGFGNPRMGVFQGDNDIIIRYVELDEAAVELISAKPNYELFPVGKDFYSTYPDYHGNPVGVAEMAIRLNRIKSYTKVTNHTLYNSHHNSQVEPFFHLLLKRTGLMLYPEDERVYGEIKALIDTIIFGGYEKMENYISGALKYNPN